MKWHKELKPAAFKRNIFRDYLALKELEGKQMKSIKEITDQLDEKIPRAVVEERDGGGGRKLSYLPGHYVIDRMNKVFGHLNWSNEILDVRQVVNTTGRGEFPAYIVKVRLSVISAETGTVSFKEGYGYGADKSSQNAHELAIKEAVTDGIKVAAKNLGMSMGLALYDRTQENVEDEPKAEAPKPKPAVNVAQAVRAPAVEPGAAQADEGKVRDLIRSYVNAGVKKGVLSMDQVKELLQTKYQADKLDALKQTQLQEVLAYVTKLVKG
jgi:hypothetical protein